MMQTDKPLQLPDRRLARAFGFSAADLLANRAGRRSWAQEIGLDPRTQRVATWLFARSPLLAELVFGGRVARLMEPQHQHDLEHIAQGCGRLRLDYALESRPSFFHVELAEQHTLHIDEADLHFRITRKQHQALRSDLVYRVYYEPQSGRLLSIERLMGGCDAP